MKGHNYGICRKCGKEHKTTYKGGKPSPFKGKYHTEGSKLKISKNTKIGMWKEKNRKKFLDGVKNRRSYVGIYNPFYGKSKIAWNKGLTKVTSGIIAKYANKCGHKWLPRKNPFFGKKHTMETKKKIQSYHYIGGISIHTGYGIDFTRELKEQIKQRDNYRCQECGCSYLESKLHIHHIDYDKTNNVIGNLITLCNRCNSKVNYNRNQWKIYFQNILRLNNIIKEEVNIQCVL